MARYHPIYEGLWDDAKLEGLSFECHGFFAFLCSNKRCRPSGIYRATDGQLVEDARLPLPRVRAHLEALAHRSRIVRDGAWLFVRGYLERQPKHERLMKRVVEDLMECTSEPIKQAFVQRYPLLLQPMRALGFKLPAVMLPSASPSASPSATASPPASEEATPRGANAPGPASPAATVHPIREFLGFYQDTFQERFSERPNIQPGKDAKLVQTLLGRYGDDMLRRYLRAFLDSDDEFIQRSGYTLGVFSACLNKVIVQGGKGQPPRLMPRTQANVGALHRFVTNLQGGPE